MNLYFSTRHLVVVNGYWITCLLGPFYYIHRTKDHLGPKNINSFSNFFKANLNSLVLSSVPCMPATLSTTIIFGSFLNSRAISRQGFEYADCKPRRKVRPTPPKNKKTKVVVLGITINCIWWWGSCSEDLGSTSSMSLILGPLWPRVRCMSQIDLFEKCIK